MDRLQRRARHLPSRRQVCPPHLGRALERDGPPMKTRTAPAAPPGIDPRAVPALLALAELLAQDYLKTESQRKPVREPWKEQR